MATETLSLKWGTLKAWKLNEDGPAYVALGRYFDQPVSGGVMQQRDTEAQKIAICDVIDALDNDQIYLDWDGEYVTKDFAKRYVMEYKL